MRKPNEFRSVRHDEIFNLHLGSGTHHIAIFNEKDVTGNKMFWKTVKAVFFLTKQLPLKRKR